MAEFNIILGFSFAIIVSLLNTILAFKVYKSIRNTFVIAQLFQLLWAIQLPITNLVIDTSQMIQGIKVNQLTGIIGTVALSISMLVNQFYFDEITALYRQRKTMTLGTLAFAGLVGFILHDGGLIIKGGGIIELSLPVMSLFLVQSGLLIYRFRDHLRNQNSLSEHYALKSTYSSFVEKYGVFVLVALFLTSFIINIILGLDILFLVSFLVPLGYLIVTMALFNDPLSSTAVGQKVQAVALLSQGKTKYLHVLASSGKSVAQNEDFSLFLNDINHLMVEIAKSETKVKSISTHDVLVMFEPCNEDILIFILQYRGPVLRKILHSMANKMLELEISTQDEFSALVEKTLLGTKQDLRVISRVNKSWAVVTNAKSAQFKKAINKWDLYIQRGNQVDFNEFNPKWIEENQPSHVLALGGDGTVHYVVNQILKTNHSIPVGILPGGGGNDTARRWSDIHKLNGEKSIIEYQDLPVLDLEFDNHKEYIVNTLEWGVGAPTAQLREDNHGKYLFGTAKYFYLVMKALNRFQSWKSAIIVDGEEKEFTNLSALLIGFGNSSLGGGFNLFPHEFNNYNNLYYFTAKNYERFHGFKILFKLLRGNHFKEENIEYKEFNRIELKPMQDDVVVLTIDGELRQQPPAVIKRSDKTITTFTVI